MAFDEMNVLHTAEVEVEGGRGTILVRLFTWKGGPAKISLSRMVDREGEPGFAKLGGMTLDEGEEVVDSIEECLAEAGKLSAKDAKSSVKRKIVKKSKKSRKKDRK